jgi:predicted RNA-binding Zn ribbon-like protein
MDISPTSVWKFLGGELCLDFANSAQWHASESPRECLNSYEELLGWAGQAQLLSQQEVSQLRREAEQRGAEAAYILERAIRLRETIYDIFSAIAHARDPQEADLSALNAVLSETLPRLRLLFTGETYVWEWTASADDLDRMLWPVVRSAAELLTSDRLSRVGQCEDDRGCGWLFVDHSRNRSRRWCDMEDCGNRAKAKRYYERQRAGA